MNNDIAIKVENLSKCYMLRHSGADDSGRITNELWALKDISFEIKKGESIGIIGPNGSGKSTLLKVLAGVSKPTSGKVQIRGRIASILDIGAGFHPELSGRENVFMNGQLLGFKRREIEAKYDEIVSFSGIEKFMEEPLKNYSSGMYLRLAFSIMAHLDFDVYLLDEVLSVGDAEFRGKCYDRIRSICDISKKTIVLISHQIDEIIHLTSKQYLMQGGRLIAGLSEDESIHAYQHPDKEILLPDFLQKLKVETNNKTGQLQHIFKNEESFLISIQNKFKTIIKDLNLAFKITDRLGNIVFITSPILTNGQMQVIDFSMYETFICEVPSHFFNTGQFYISIHYFDYADYNFEIRNVKSFHVEIEKKLHTTSFKKNTGPVLPYFNWKLK